MWQSNFWNIIKSILWSKSHWWVTINNNSVNPSSSETIEIRQKYHGKRAEYRLYHYKIRAWFDVRVHQANGILIKHHIKDREKETDQVPWVH